MSWRRQNGPNDLETVVWTFGEFNFCPSNRLLMGTKIIAEKRLRRWPKPTAGALNHILESMYAM